VRGTRALLRILGCCAALAVCAPPAHAGTYDVWGCRLPDGSSAPINGWAPIEPNGSTDSCASTGGGLKAQPAVVGGATPMEPPGWLFTAPANLRIDNFTLFRHVHMSGADPRTYELFLDTSDQRMEVCNQVAGCVVLGTETQAFAGTNRAEGQRLSLSRLGVWLTCHWTTGSCPPSDPASYVVVFSSRIGLSDDSRPTFVRGPSGPLVVADHVIGGEQDVRYAAEDIGGGMARVAVVVDGVVRKEEPVVSAGGSCREPYVALVPCPLASDGSVSFDTATLPDGPHGVAVALIDAAGNRTLSPAETVVFKNRRVPNGANATRSAELRAWFPVGEKKARASRTVSFGQRARILGTLTTEDGTHIRGATIEVTSTPRTAGAAARRLSPITTDERGRFSFTPTDGSSRRFTLSYRPFDTDPSPAAAAVVTLNVRAGVSLKVKPRRTTSRGRISFSGRLLGGPNREGTQVQLFAVARKGLDRVPVATLRADRRGRFQFKYRFRRTFAPFTYYFQAVVQRQNGYPYATGSSKRVSVRIVR
jgi:hypothetical protein